MVLLLALSFSRVTFANQILSGTRIEELALAEINAMLDERGESRRREILLHKSIGNISLPEGIIDVQIIMPSNTISYTTNTPIKARVFVNGKMYREFNFVASIKVFDYVLVANHDLRIEVPVTESDFRLEEVAVDGRTEYLKDAKKLRGLVAQRFIRAGSPVAANYFQQPFAVQSGSIVQILYKQGGLRVSAKGIVMMRGRIGQIVKVKNEVSLRVVSARVIDAQTVEVVS